MCSFPFNDGSLSSREVRRKKARTILRMFDVKLYVRKGDAEFLLLELSDRFVLDLGRVQFHSVNNHAVHIFHAINSVTESYFSWDLSGKKNKKTARFNLRVRTCS